MSIRDPRPSARSRRPRPPSRALPRLPRGLSKREAAWGVHFISDGTDYTTIAITPDDLSTDARGRLLERAEIRFRRLQARARRERVDHFWMAAELRLILGRCHRNVVTRWRDRVRWARAHAEREADRWRQLEAVVLAHEPETDAWLRRRLAELEGGREG